VVGCHQDNQESKDWDWSRSGENSSWDSDNVISPTSKYHPHIWRWVYILWL